MPAVPLADHEDFPLTRQDRRRQRTRTQLLDSARALIVEKGVAALRIGEITEHADLGRGSFYNYFQSKEDVLAAIATETLEALATTVLADLPHDHDPASRASVADRRFIRLPVTHPEFAQLLVNLDHGDQLYLSATAPYARAAIQAGIDSGRFTVPNLDVALTILAGGAFALIRAILTGHAPPDADQAHAESVLRLLGLPNDEAREISRRPLDGTPQGKR